MLNSAEVRWFFRGQSPAEVKHWLDMGEQHKQEAREDEYVLIPSCQTTGIKLRNDRFEIKALTCRVGEERFAAKIEGVVEKWAKLILAVPREARNRSGAARRSLDVKGEQSPLSSQIQLRPAQ